MEELWRENRIDPESEIVLIYRQPDQVEPVVLRYERELPACMRPRPVRSGREGTFPPPRRIGPLDPPEKRKARWGVRVYVGVSLLAALICLGVGIWYVGEYGWALPGSKAPDGPHSGSNDNIPWEDDYFWDIEDTDSGAITIPSYPTGGETRLSLSSAAELPVLTPQEVYNQVTPSVVSVLGREDMYSTMASAGTGVIFSSNGYILTNCHIIAGCSMCRILVTNAHGVDEAYDAKVVGYDEDVDLAVLKVEAEDLPAAVFGVSDDLRVGDQVYAIGNPLGVELRNTLTDGIISAIDRDMDVDGVQMTLLQTTAALNSGNSGGPLINEYGQVVGINTIKMMSRYDTIEGLGFAIPSSLALRWVNELIEFGELQPEPVLGVTVNRIPQTLPDGTVGLRLEEITDGLSGDRAGLRAGDYLVGFAGQNVVSLQQLMSIRRGLRVGDEVAVRVFREGEYLELTMIMMAES
ncbi:MAG: trypsin-like peptidase domain-containing protein [Oscillospiraceae bacterium]|nr:trypsin-like peptidase domain-containing protein [Oscillospiraceae bacterium]